MRLFNFDLDTIERFATRHLRLFMLMMAALLVLVGIIAILIFFAAVKGAEQTMVPEVRGKELTEAILELQMKELYPRIQLRYSQSSRERGHILEQDPRAGTIVKAGRQVRLVVSQGVMLNRVENYVGRNIDEVRMDLQTLISASGSPLLTLKEPLMYDFSIEAPGTILRQKPESGADISGPMNLEFVVSQGPEHSLITAPLLTGLSLSSALEQIGRMKIVFEFSIRETREGEKGETVVFQSPPAGTSITSNTVVDLTVTTPANLGEGEVYKLFSYTMPKNPYPLPVRLEAVLPSGKRDKLIGVDFPGGKFTVPYRLPIESILILSMINREIHREMVTK
ncbi:MAG: PASTA domain-containing protein [Treponema sp.]|jgi:beta-lactam-binding protein with PASTA domain|nr:PASTA domain-containing protein [Treponema sp.]